MISPDPIPALRSHQGQEPSETQSRRETIARLVEHAEMKSIPFTRVFSAKQIRFMYQQLVEAEAEVERLRALASASASPHPEKLLQRVQNYLGNGGFFNPEAMEHDKVRELIMDLACGHGWHFGATCAPTNSGESVIAGTDLEGRAGKPPLGATSLSATSEHIDSPESLGLSIDMLDVDRLREWARLLLVHGADISHWGSVPFVASKMQTMATELEKAIRDIGVLRLASASPHAKGEELPKWLTDRIVLPVRWDGEDLLGADNRILMWGKQGDDDKDDCDRALGKWVADALNAAAPSARPASLKEPQQPNK